VQTKTYTTEAGAKKAAARAYSPAVVRLANGRYSWVHPGPLSSQTPTRLASPTTCQGLRRIRKGLLCAVLPRGTISTICPV
jgi:hypothetical protein